MKTYTTAQGTWPGPRRARQRRTPRACRPGSSRCWRGSPCTRTAHAESNSLSFPRLAPPRTHANGISELEARGAQALLKAQLSILGNDLVQISVKHNLPESSRIVLVILLSVVLVRIVLVMPFSGLRCWFCRHSRIMTELSVVCHRYRLLSAMSGLDTGFRVPLLPVAESESGRITDVHGVAVPSSFTMVQRFKLRLHFPCVVSCRDGDACMLPAISKANMHPVKTSPRPLNSKDG
ncbi:hypothetical protein VTK56DRAFT_279 [Thermocarpiscus australiensis]